MLIEFLNDSLDFLTIGGRVGFRRLRLGGRVSLLGKGKTVVYGRVDTSLTTEDSVSGGHVEKEYWIHWNLSYLS